jgi:LuxR family transcriptional regulator, regulator of acetate metabolism
MHARPARAPKRHGAPPHPTLLRDACGRVSARETNSAAALKLPRVLVELQQLEREIVELDHVRRADALERVRDAVRRLGELGSPAGILERAAAELGTSSQFDRVLISDVREGQLFTHALWIGEDPSAARTVLEKLGGRPIRLDYPLIEEEVARRQGAEIVDVLAARTRATARLADVLGWERYVVAALTVHGSTIGLLHADATTSGRTLDVVDREVAAHYTEGLAGVFERAVLRETLQQHRRELQSAIQWMSGRLSRLAEQASPASPSPGGADGAGEALTPREREVLVLLARGRTNSAIAAELVVGEGTVKYHVKNILRKLGATSRADAVARYLRSANEGR